MYKLFTEYSKHLLENTESDQLTQYIVYHGSPYKFDKFDIDQTTDFHNGQPGSDYYFWFTDNEKAARKFALQYPQEYDEKYDEYYTSRNKELEGLQKKYPGINDIIKNINKFKNDITDNFIYMIINDLKDHGMKFIYSYVRGLQMGLMVKDPDTWTELYNYIDNEIKKYEEYSKGLEQKIEKIYDQNIKDLKNEYDNRPGYLYTVELNIANKNIEVLNGEDIGTNWGRIWSIDACFAEGADLVINKFADSGPGGLIDEYIVADDKHIQILEIEEVYSH